LASAIVGVLAMSALSAGASVTPVFLNNNASGTPSQLFGDHDVDMTAGSPPDTISDMPATGLIPGTATLLNPWPSPGTTINSGTGSSRAKGGAGHTEGSNLAKITFPSGVGLDQTDPSHILGPSQYKIGFNYIWSIPNNTLGPPMSGTFSIPLGIHVGAGGAASFAWDVHWDARINNIAVPNVRSPFTGVRNYNTAGTFVDSVTAPSSTFTPTGIAGGNGNLIVVRGSITFTANNEDSRSLIEILGSTLKDVDDVLRADPILQSQWQDPAHPEFRVDANSGFEEQLPEPSSVLLASIGSAAMLLRRRRQVSSRT